MNVSPMIPACCIFETGSHGVSAPSKILPIIAALGAVGLAGCSGVSSNMPNLGVPTIDLFDPPATDTLAIESTPTGAEAHASSGGVCRTPCALSVPLNEPFTVTYTLDGYVPQTVSVRSIRPAKSALVDMTPARLEPNPVSAELQPAPPPEPPPVRRRQRQ